MSDVTLYLGDCLEIMKQIPDQSIQAVVTDPPYGMDWNTDFRRFSGGPSAHRRPYHNKRNYEGGVRGDDAPFDPSPWLDFPKVVLWGYNHFASCLPVGTTLIWLKRFDPAFGSFLSDAELAWMKGGHGVYCRRDVSLNAETQDRMHPTQKPVGLMKWCLDMAKIPIGATVLDPFMGSGSTGVACVKTGRNFIGCEIDEQYFNLAQRRIEQAQMQLPLGLEM